ncbi:PadR family transcriptional regulator [Acinetobacter chinensis]|jgi:DNA-binding PadR family transcriptional regulator|uniref:PadR family transcriptional regulator n=1 Tax=Acinetobacter chinensis TaxID=2004650 RepID=A0A3B7LTQ8_9GAMM|nr:PadR family transcriptional regulator [Acinetobacter chinensis]AXY55384.1 PadR family transcriptional regulator [Acinetobacter chinensis]
MIEKQQHGERRGRLFEAGRMKLLVLHLIAQSPKHGYEIIKEISELVGDGYSPSAGTIYPTLNWLEDMQFVTVQQTDAERKQYSITLAGETHLQQQQKVLQTLLEKLQMRRDIHEKDELLDIYRAMENLKTALRLKLKSSQVNPEQIQQIAEKIDQAAVEIGRL